MNRPDRLAARTGNVPPPAAVRMWLARWLGLSLPDFPGKNRAVRRLLPHTGGDAEFDVPFFGTRYRGRIGDYIDSQVWAYGGYELGFLRAWQRAFQTFPEGPVLFVDVGANSGHHSIALAPLCQRAVAFEAHPRLHARLAQRVAASGRGNVCTVWAAAGGTDGPVLLTDLAHLRNSGMSRTVPCPSRCQDVRRERLIEVPGVRLDTYFASLKAESVFLKIDVEGAERAVVDGGARFLRQNRVLVHVESQDASAIRALQDLGFHGWSLRNWYRRFRLLPLDPAVHSDHLLANFACALASPPRRGRRRR